MDSTLYKATTVGRGYTYQYYFSPPSPGKPILLFLHGFPSTSYDWHKQVSYLRPLGYGLLVPDLLGAGGTAKPLDSKEYRLNAMADDVIAILMAEGIEKVVGISHDWGSVLLSRLSMLYPQIFLGFVWVALAFYEPSQTPFDIEASMAFSKSRFGVETIAYWEFFCRPDAHTVIEKNVDSFLQLSYANDADCWSNYVVQRGKFAECVENNILLGRALWLTEEYLTLKQTILKNGIQAQLLWYHCQANDHNLPDDLNIPEERKVIPAPSLVALAMHDWVCRPEFVTNSMTKYGSNVEYIECQTGHWLQLERADELNEAIHRWVEKLLSN